MPFCSARYADIEIGLIRMVLCRVIMGNVEPLVLNSKQFQPTNYTFDSGVDNLQSPNYYVIWDTDLEKHILPEYAVTIKMPEKAKGMKAYCLVCALQFSGIVVVLNVFHLLLILRAFSFVFGLVICLICCCGVEKDLSYILARPSQTKAIFMYNNYYDLE
jgi:hypothetical protein